MDKYKYKTWHKYKTKPVKADTTILGNKTLLRYFRNVKNTTINENTDLLEYQSNDSKVPCLPLSMILIAFHTSHTQNTKGHSGSEKKTNSNFTQNFYFPNAPIWIKVLCNDYKICQLNKPYPNQKQIPQKQDFKRKIYILVIAFHSIQKDQFHHLLKETPTLWSLLTHSHIM